MSAKFNIKLLLSKVEYSGSGENIGRQWEFITKEITTLPSVVHGNAADFNKTQNTTVKLSHGETKTLNEVLIDANVESNFSNVVWPIDIDIVATERDLGKDDVGVGSGSIRAAIDDKPFSTEVVIPVEVENAGIGSGNIALLNFTFTLTSEPVGAADLEGDKYRTVLAMSIARAWKDPAYRAKLVADPNAVVKEEGLSFPANVKFVILEDTPTVKYLNLSRNANLDDYGYTQIMKNVLPIAEGTEIRMVQSTENTRYLVLPQLPKNVDVQATPDADLVGIATAQSSTANVTQTVNVTTAVNVQTAAQVTTELTVAEVVVAAVAVVT